MPCPPPTPPCGSVAAERQGEVPVSTHDAVRITHYYVAA